MTRQRWAWVLFFAALTLYLSVGYWLHVHHEFILGDTLARVHAASSVTDSRHPHLAALGFIFTPLTALVELPALQLAPAFPALLEQAFAGTIMSALFMAGAVVQVFGMGVDRGLPSWFTGVITALFALNPMIIFYGANGMSEAPFVFFGLWAVRRLVLWMVDDDVHHLVVAGGIAMGLAYLTRYDAVAFVAAAGVLVGVTTYRRAPEPPRYRRVLLDVLLVSGPGAAAFAGWAAVSWLVTGEAFAQFSSQYGNSAIMAQSGAQGPPALSAGLLFAAVSIGLLAPTLLPLAAWAAVLRWRRPNWQMLAVPLLMFGSVLAFQALAYATGSTFGFLRFYIAAIPLATTVALLAAPDGRLRVPKRRGRHAPARSSTPSARWVSRYSYAPAVLLLAVSLPVTGWGMGLVKYAPQEFALTAVLAPNADDTSERAAAQRRIAVAFRTERELARYLDSLGLPDGSVLVDTMSGFGVVAASTQPRMFVIPSDHDFVRLLNNPAAHHVRYLLAVPPTGRGVSDALNRRYPTLYETGAEVASLVLEIPNDGDNQPDWRLYRVNEPVPQPGTG